MVDAEDSKSSASDGVRVQVSPPAPPKIKGLAGCILLNLFCLLFRWGLAGGLKVPNRHLKRGRLRAVVLSGQVLTTSADNKKISFRSS